MVRTYKKTPGTRNYRNYTDDALEEALQKVTDGELTINAASLAYKIPFGTLYNRYKGLHGKPAGGQTIFTHEEEKNILKAAATCSDWGFPLTSFDIRMLAKAYLDKQGKICKKFNNNMPGIDWAMSLLKRHKGEFAQRVATNIKRARAQVSRSSLSEYFENLKKEIEGVPPSNIFNYDESNLSDDPGKKKSIFRRGVKYPERVMNHSKSSTTIMICGSADGTLLPPYVIYKSTHLYDTWKERGIVGEPCCSQSCCSRGSRYNRTQSGWIDGPTFRDWFTTTFLPHADRLEGRKVIIGDNLSTHLDTDVLKLCEAHNISFVCLVPNSTHICQPLDVGFFRPMKSAWRKTLDEWKMQHLKWATIPKEKFPSLLKNALIAMDQVSAPQSGNSSENSAIKRNLINSFNAAGISPWDKDKVLKKIPSDEPETSCDSVINNVLTSYLKEQRFGNAQNAEPPKKRTRLQVQPGKSVATIDDSNDKENENDETARAHNTALDMIEAGPSGINVADNNDTDSDATRCDGPEIGNYVLAKFPSAKGKRNYQYVCVIEDISMDKIVVKGLKSYRKDKRKFSIVDDDVSIIEDKDIIMYLPLPKYEENGLYVFPADIPIKEL